MGASAHLRWVAVVAAASLAAAVPAGAQQPASPDAAPSGSSAPRPDPAPVKTRPPVKTKPRVVVRAAPRPAAPVTRTVAPSVPTATTTEAKPRASRPARRAVTRRTTSHPRKAARGHKPAALALPRLPHLTLTQLSAPTSTADAGRARKLAVGALSLLILALASATLLAFTARVERRRVVR
jgi:hypothetical protein